MNAYNISPKKIGTFDVVFFLRVIYHLRHPLLMIDRIWDILNSGGLVIVETHIIDEGLVKKGKWVKLSSDIMTLNSLSSIKDKNLLMTIQILGLLIKNCLRRFLKTMVLRLFILGKRILEVG